MFYIHLNDMAFTTCHGVLSHEKKTPQTFIVDVQIETDVVVQAGITDDVNDTINYADVYLHIQTIMNGEPVNLIETLAKKISDTLIANFCEAIAVTTKVTKVRPPIETFTGTVSCEYIAYGDMPDA